MPVGRKGDRPPPRCDSTREKNVFDQDRRMGRKADIKPPPREVLRNRRFLSQLLGTFVWRQKYLARRRNTPQPDHHPTAGKFGRGKPLPYGVPRCAAVAETVPLIRPSVRTGAPSPRGRLTDEGAPNHPAPRTRKPQTGPAVPVGRKGDRPPPRCDSTREKNVFDQDRRMGRKADIKPPPREVLRNRRFLSQLLGTFVWRQKYLARRRNLLSKAIVKQGRNSKEKSQRNKENPRRMAGIF